MKSRPVLLLLVHNIFIILLWCWKPSNLFCFEFTFVVFSLSSLLQNGRSSPCSPEHGGRLEVEGGYCCVYLPDGSASLAPTRNGQLIKDMLASLCEKRAFPLKDVVIYLNGKDKVRRARLLCTQHHLQPTQWKAVQHLAAAGLFCDRNKWEIIIFCNYSNTFTCIFYISFEAIVVFLQIISVLFEKTLKRSAPSSTAPLAGPGLHHPERPAGHSGAEGDICVSHLSECFLPHHAYETAVFLISHQNGKPRWQPLNISWGYKQKLPLNKTSCIFYNSVQLLQCKALELFVSFPSSNCCGFNCYCGHFISFHSSAGFKTAVSNHQLFTFVSYWE